MRKADLFWRQELSRVLVVYFQAFLLGIILTCATHGQTVDSFNPGASGSVYALAVQPDGKIVIGGSFTSLGGVPRAHIGRVATDGSVDPSFDPGASNSVYALAVQPTGKSW